ncbi:hypothetical protein BVC80_1713g64 [Macleaya cordata]|uniref:Uncharacterized protein n=1 Tax=Macleaya cordata TaxID=56857 RepID=A0A200Q2C8_MACCD|nr:hypothetical protein BVC80_1713g64 [Macleaya cordata]
MKATVSTEKIWTVTHDVIIYAQRTSISTMRTVLYEIMRKRRVRHLALCRGPHLDVVWQHVQGC